LWVYDAREFPLRTGGNVYYSGARPYSKEATPLTLSGVDPKLALVEEGDSVYLHLTLGSSVQKVGTTRVTTSLLGKARVAGLAYENTDGSPVVIDSDYFGKKREESNSCAGPFENPGQGELKLKVW
jgi:alpha-N-arabinofuranosidase